MNKNDLQLFTMEFYIERGKDFCVIIKGWNRIGFNDGDLENPVEKFNWNVYACIFESHPLFSDVERAMDVLPFSGGVTYDKLISTSPTGGNKYDKKEASSILKLGSDYGHSWDDYDSHQSPKDGVPSHIMNDANNLVEKLKQELSK